MYLGNVEMGIVDVNLEYWEYFWEVWRMKINFCLFY